jgi:hypothetical protein
VRTEAHPEGALGGFARTQGNRAPGQPTEVQPDGVNLAPGADGTLVVRFAPTFDPEGYAVRYVWTARAAGSERALTEAISGAHHPVPMERIYDYLRAEGYAPGSAARLTHTVVATDGSAFTASEPATINLVVATGAGDASELPRAFALVGTYPNPATSSATLLLDAPRAAAVRVTVFDLLGRRVFARREHVAGGHAQRLDLPVTRLASGVYLVRAEIEGAAPWQASTRLVVAR